MCTIRLDKHARDVQGNGDVSETTANLIVPATQDTLPLPVGVEVIKHDT